ncbi:YdeI/OmpD-associated family protein [Candidatus Saccharibacteria bacterium]|nr:YdeI/OmpD-associated family protein [Candidatus Saccharibacteria bacterium]
MNSQLANGVVHKMPNDFAKAILSDKKVHEVWDDITPLARNEWICWVTDAKKDETRTRRIVVGLDKMRKGMRRPCCWAGCAHRKR